MKKKSRRKKNEERKRRFDAIKDLMSTFTMGTIAVVAAVTLIPSSPKAEIIKSVALNKEIVYQVNVTDEDNALDLSSLYVVLENQLEYYENPITLGENSGYFDSLENDTQYRLSVYGNKGFGKERLDTLLITTDEKIGGSILAVTPVSENMEFSTNYMVDVSIYDPNSIYTSINLYYGYAWEPDSEIEYSTIPITESNMNIELFGIHTPEAFHIYIEGTSIEGTMMLDDIWITPPYNLQTFVNYQFVSSKEIGFYLYGDMGAEHITYEMNVYKNNFLLKTQQVVFEKGEHESGDFIIDGLLANTTYDFECIATYTNPQTLRIEKAVVYTEELTTLKEYSYSYKKEIVDNSLLVTITLNDPSHNFQEAYYLSEDTSGEFDYFIESGTHFFEATGNEKSVTFTIPLPTSLSYKITIEIRNQENTSKKQRIDIIIYE